MKNFLLRVICVCLCMVALVPLTACREKDSDDELIPNADFEEAVSALEGKGYYVQRYDDGFRGDFCDFIEVAYDEEYGFKSRPLLSYANDLYSIPMEKGVIANDEEAMECIYLMYFNSASNAKKCYYNEQLEAFFKEYARMYRDMVGVIIDFGISGNMVWFGTRKAIADTN